MVQFNIITFKKSYSQKIMNSKDKNQKEKRMQP